ncbi:hypothetical protein T4E_9520 [Trichinella pseudospiralis]|uniref:Uncharacterized protein n=1 Tax=Trichinella pseudospiralis TaxID=6337 RepID=A0A0V0YL25_TRIPS|nr:hypothetical protein T4E_9520 [Trichinella pseudospiralis]
MSVLYPHFRLYVPVCNSSKMKVSKHKHRQVKNNSLVRRHWRNQSVKNLLVDALHKFFAVVRIKVKQFFTINEQLDIVRGVEQLETPPEAYLAFLMPMALSRLTRDLSVKWERRRTDEKNTAKELLTWLKAVKIRIRERYRCLDFSTTVAAIDGQENARMHNVLRESPNLELSEISQNQHRIRKTGNCWVTGIVPCMLDEKSLAEYEPHGWQPPARGCFVKAGSRTIVSCFLDSSFQRSCVSIGVEDAINVEGLIKRIFVASFARVCRKSKKARCKHCAYRSSAKNKKIMDKKSLNTYIFTVTGNEMSADAGDKYTIVRRSFGLSESAK